MDGMIGLYIGCGSLLLGIFGFMWKISSDMRKYNEEGNAKRGRVYQRLDENKAHAEEIYVRKDLCKILHQQIGLDVTEIKKDVKSLLKKNGLE